MSDFWGYVVIGGFVVWVILTIFALQIRKYQKKTYKKFNQRKFLTKAKNRNKG